MQNIKAYLRRATAREYLGCYKEANEGDNVVSVNFYFVRKCIFNVESKCNLRLVLWSTDFRYALVLEPTNRTAIDGAKRLRKLLSD